MSQLPKYIFRGTYRGEELYIECDQGLHIVKLNGVDMSDRVLEITIAYKKRSLPKITMTVI